MPTIGIDQVPREIVRPKWYEDYGYMQGALARAVLQAMMGQVGSRIGQVPTTPTSQNPGTFNFPPGSQSPMEAQQISQLGGVPTNAGVMARSTQQPGGAGVTYSPPTKLGLQPDFSKVLEQLKIQEAQQNIGLIRDNAAYLRGITPKEEPVVSGNNAGAGTPSSPIPPSVTSQFLKDLASKSQQGDAKSADMIRRLATERDDPEAIAILQSWGEL